MPKYKIMYIVIGVICAIAIIIGIYVQFFVQDQDKNNLILPTLNVLGGDEQTEKTQEEIKAQFMGLFTNQFLLENNSNINITKLDNTKDIVYTAYESHEQNENYEVDIYLPVINISADIPINFNNNTQSIFANKAAEILSNQNTEKTIYSVYYTANITGNILSVAIESNLKVGNNPQRVIVQTYNYNLLTGEEVKLVDLLASKNILRSDAHKKIMDVVQKADDNAKKLLESGYSVYSRDLTSSIYQINNINTFFLGKSGDLYVIFPYGNNNYTSEMDVVWFE